MTAIQQWWFSSGVPRGVNYAKALRADNPYIWWRMDEAEDATTGADSGTLGLPFTTDPTSAAFGGAPLWQQGGSLVLNGTGFNGAVTEHTSAVNFGAGFTITALVRWTGVTDAGAIVAHGETNTDWANWALFVSNTGHVQLWLSSANAEAQRTTFGTDLVLDLNTTYRIAARWIPDTGEVGIWINDTRALTDTWLHTLWSANSPVGIGTVPHSSGLNNESAPFIGSIDEVAIYAQPLSDDRLHAHWLALQGSSPPVDDVDHVEREDTGYSLREDGGFVVRE